MGFYNYRILSSDFTLRMNPEKDPEIHDISDESHWEITFVDTKLNTLKGVCIKRLEKYIKGDTVFEIERTMDLCEEFIV